jgi:hypothetical protein
LHVLAATISGDTSLGTGEALLAYLRAAGPDDALRQELAHALARWDFSEADADWTAGTERNTPERRRAVLAALGVDDDDAVQLFNDLFLVAAIDTPTVIADNWEEWRTPERRAERDFYWAHYERYLLDKGWDPVAVASVDEASEEVVRRLSDPTREMAYQSKGLVVGYVQSGKTANFTGVAAKAIDTGYRLVIVLTGTTNMLRAQTQRRMDMELCGRENLEREISKHDHEGHDYQDDPDWRNDRFVRHGGRPSDTGHPDIHRLSTHRWDYRRLRQGIAALEFERRERHRPFYHPSNLYTSNARLVVAKKNSTVLKALVADLGRISERLEEVPVLIIDDESDQASVNTSSPKKWKEDRRERTAINRHISTLLKMMPRAQYVGYTATPYANVFIDPSDIEDIFPKDFLISLPRPAGYMGPQQFHDFDTDVPSGQRSFEESNERAHVRFLSDEPDDHELRTAIDMFVLTGAVKLHRERHGAGSYRHHTMLVHEAMGRDVHRDAAELIKTLWHRGGYQTPAGLARLRELYERDVLPVARARAGHLPTPELFDDLGPDIAEALRRISPADSAASMVIVVNSDKDLEKQQESLDFDKRSIWRILVGGNKLARGFTVEGLTVTYYRRATKQADTLMQMGRWFGYRPGYRDLVRLYTTPDLHERFEAAVRDEEFLRDELRRYARPTDGGRLITPRQVPPLIAQHRPDLRPTGRTKMWNARLVEKSYPGEPMEPVAHPSSPAVIRRNTQLWEPVLASATEVVSFRVTNSSSTFNASVAVVRHQDMLAILGGLTWLFQETFQPELTWLRSLSPEQLNQWVVIIPHHQRAAGDRRTLLGHGPFSMFQRTRPTTKGAFKAFSDKAHRNAAYRIAGVSGAHEDLQADKLAGPATAAIIVYPSVENTPDGSQGDAIDPAKVTLGFHVITPLSSAPTDGRLIKWTVIDSGNRGALVVDASA